jgi:hypothetical protein
LQDLQNLAVDAINHGQAPFSGDGIIFYFDAE